MAQTVAASLVVLASGASALVVGHSMPSATTRTTAAAIMQVGPVEQEGQWTFRHGPGQLADQGALAWATAGGPAEYIAKPRGAAVAAVIEIAAALPAAPENPALSSSATRDPEEMASAKAAWLAKSSSGSVAPTRAVPVASGPPAPLEKDRQWEFRHGAGRLQPISCGGP